MTPMAYPYTMFEAGMPVYLEESGSRGIITYNVETAENGRSYVVKKGDVFIATPHCNIQPLH